MYSKSIASMISVLSVVFTGRVRKLLHRLDGVPLEHFLPRRIRRRSEITVDTPDGRFAGFCYLGEQAFDDGCLRIVSINQNGKPES